MPSEAGTGIKSLEAERLGAGRRDDFPDVDAHRVQDDLHFVDHRDIDGAVDVLQDLCRFGDFGGRNRDHLLDCQAVERGRRHAVDGGSIPPTSFGIVWVL